MTKLDIIKKKISEKKPVIGSHVMLSDSCITEMMGQTGIDFVWIDSEHTALDKKDILLHIVAVKGTGAAAFVRIPWNDPVLVKPILEMGVEGIIFPYVRTAEEARLAVASCTYPPAGIRGFGPIRATRYGMVDTKEYIETAHTQIWKIIQIEHVDAVNNLDEILEIEGVDAIVVGPNDLSGSIGLLGQTNHPEVIKLVDTIGEKAVKHGKPFGVSMGSNPKAVEEWIRRGINMIVLDSDVGYIMKGCKETYRFALEMFGKVWNGSGGEGASEGAVTGAGAGYSAGEASSRYI